MGLNITELTGDKVQAIINALLALEPGLVTTTQAGKLAPDAEAIADGFIKLATSSNKGLMSKAFAALLEDPSKVVFNDCSVMSTAAYHNSIYRGKNLGSSFTAEQKAAIAAGTFKDMFIGDFWTIGGVTYRIADFDYWYHYGDTECTTHHVVIVPDANMLTGNGSSTHWMNATDITTGAYVGSDFYTGNNSNNGKATILSAIKSAFGNGNILNHREYLTNAVTNGKPSAGSWYDSEVEIPNEKMVYGNAPFTPVSDGSTIPTNYTIDHSQLALFRLDHSRICNRADWWLRDPVSGALFAYVSNNGACTFNGASNAWVGVRPVFGIRG